MNDKKIWDEYLVRVRHFLTPDKKRMALNGYHQKEQK